MRRGQPVRLRNRHRPDSTSYCSQPVGRGIIGQSHRLAVNEDLSMLNLGRQRQRDCHGVTRRAFLQAGGSSLLGLTLADLLRTQAQAGEPMAGSAKSVMLIWLWGGPAHLDTWDPKPNA